MKGTIKLLDGVSFEATSGSGHKIITDGSPDFGGQNKGVRPMELVLLGLGACTAFDVVHILRKCRQDVFDCQVELEAERAETEPKVFTKIHVHFILSGKDLKDKQVERAISLSADKYCSASIMLGKTAKITHDYEIVPAS